MKFDLESHGEDNPSEDDAFLAERLRRISEMFGGPPITIEDVRPPEPPKKAEFRSLSEPVEELPPPAPLQLTVAEPEPLPPPPPPEPPPSLLPDYQAIVATPSESVALPVIPEAPAEPEPVARVESPPVAAPAAPVAPAVQPPTFTSTAPLSRLGRVRTTSVSIKHEGPLRGLWDRWFGS